MYAIISVSENNSEMLGGDFIRVVHNAMRIMYRINSTRVNSSKFKPAMFYVLAPKFVLSAVTHAPAT